MPVVTFLLSLLARRANDIIQAIFGWSVTALFGRLPRRSQILVTGALVLSLAWPLFVLGVSAPHVAAWAIALVPLHDLIGNGTLRAIWAGLAVFDPLIVGLLVWLAAPLRRGGVVRAIVSGYLIALGFSIAFVVIVITVPALKIASIIRRWSDEHVYLQPHHGQYDTVVREIAEACERAGIAPSVTDAPGYMVFATTVMRTFAGAAVAPFVSDTLRRITAEGLEIYVYPADLLLRGNAEVVAQVRAMLTRTELDRHAYLVGSHDAQRLQNDLADLARIAADLADGHPEAAVAGRRLGDRLQQTYRDIMTTHMPYDEWVILDAMARRVERRLLNAGLVSPQSLPIDRFTDHVAQAGGAQAAVTTSSTTGTAHPTASTSDPRRGTARA